MQYDGLKEGLNGVVAFTVKILSFLRLTVNFSCYG